MGQYHRVVNIDKKQYLSPHEFCEGYKLLEWGSGGLTGTALAVLLAVSNGRGGGDLHTEHDLIGSWGGDRIAVVGDYWEQDEADSTGIPTWATLDAEYTDISAEILRVLAADVYLREDLLRSVAIYDFGRDYSDIFSPEEIQRVRQEFEAARRKA